MGRGVAPLRLFQSVGFTAERATLTRTSPAPGAGQSTLRTVSTPEKAELARKAGAAHVVNYRGADAADQIRAAAGQADRIIELALGANLALDLAVAKPGSTIVTYAAEPADPALPVRACMTANLTMRFVLLYGVPRAALRRAAEDITAALGDGALTELPVHRFPLSGIVAAQEACEAGPLGKVLVVPSYRQPGAPAAGCRTPSPSWQRQAGREFPRWPPASRRTGSR